MTTTLFTEQLSTWQNDALRDAATRYLDDYSPDQQASIEAELARRGIAARPRRSATGVEGFADGFARSGGHPARNYVFAALAAFALGLLGLKAVVEVLLGEGGMRLEGLVLLGGFPLAVVLALKSLEARRRS